MRDSASLPDLMLEKHCWNEKKVVSPQILSRWVYWFPEKYWICNLLHCSFLAQPPPPNLHVSWVLDVGNWGRHWQTPLVTVSKKYSAGGRIFWVWVPSRCPSKGGDGSAMSRRDPFPEIRSTQSHQTLYSLILIRKTAVASWLSHCPCTMELANWAT